MPSNKGEGRLGRSDVLAGFVCATILLVISVNQAKYTSFFLAHNRPLVILIGIPTVLFSLLWLLAMIIEGIRFRAIPWRPVELWAIASVLITLLATAVTAE